MIAEGGKAVYGANIGLLMLEARYPRIQGDMGNALSWPFPVHSIHSFVCWFRASLAPPRFPDP